MRGVPFAINVHLRHIHAHAAGGGTLARERPRLLLGDRRAGGDLAEIFHGLGPRFGRGDVADHHQGGVGGTVVGAEPGLEIVDRGGVEVLHRTNRVVVIRVVQRVRVGLDVLLHAQAVGLVLVLALLVLHHAALLVHLVLAQAVEQVAHAVGLHPQRHVQRSGRHGFKVIGAVIGGGAIHAGSTGLLERLEVIAIVMTRPLEHQVLEDVGVTALAHRLARRAHVVPHGHGHHGRLVVLADHHGETVGQGEAGKRDLRQHRLGRCTGCHRRGVRR